jgi:opacity protein-like surface antigen
MSLRKWLVTAGLVTVASVAAPSKASADWIVTPFVGWNFNGTADVNGTGGSSFGNQLEKKIDYGVSLAAMGAGVVGFEVDFGYSPNFFESSSATAGNGGFDLTNDSNMTTLTANAIVGIPIGGQRGGSVRPYVVGGVGLLRSNLGDAGDFFVVNTKNDFGFDVGGGVMGFFNSNIGVRGDVRYFRSFRGSDDNLTGLALGNVNFWRGSVGLSFKF